MQATALELVLFDAVVGGCGHAVAAAGMLGGVGTAIGCGPHF